MEKMKHYQGAAMRLLKALLAAYIVTGGLLLLLALLLYKLRLSESVINLSITAIYLIACFLAGFLMGKMMKTRKYLWGAAGGLLYFTLLALISLAARQRRSLQLHHHPAPLHRRRHARRHALINIELHPRQENRILLSEHNLNFTHIYTETWHTPYPYNRRPPRPRYRYAWPYICSPH